MTPKTPEKLKSNPGRLQRSSLCRILQWCDGIGAYLESYIDHIKSFHGGTRANDPEYANLKSECGFKLAELINNRNIWIRCSKDQEERIKEEISVCLKRDKVDADEYRKRLIPKSIMKEKLGRSPDYLDYMIQRMYFEVQVSRAQIISG